MALDGALKDTVATKYDIEILKCDLTIRLGGMIFTAVAVLIAFKYFG